MSAHNSMLKVDNVSIKSPSEMTWGFQRVSAKDAGRTEDAVMHVNQVGQKRKLTLKWNNISRSDAHTLATAFQPQYIDVTYWDLLAGENVTKKFYTGDWSAPYRMWTANDKIYSSFGLDLIEV